MEVPDQRNGVLFGNWRLGVTAMVRWWQNKHCYKPSIRNKENVTYMVLCGMPPCMHMWSLYKLKFRKLEDFGTVLNDENELGTTSSIRRVTSVKKLIICRHRFTDMEHETNYLLEELLPCFSVSSIVFLNCKVPTLMRVLKVFLPETNTAVNGKKRSALVILDEHSKRLPSFTYTVPSLILDRSYLKMKADERFVWKAKQFDAVNLIAAYSEEQLCWLMAALEKLDSSMVTYLVETNKRQFVHRNAITHTYVKHC